VNTALFPVVAFARLIFTDLLAYRLRYVVGVLNYLIYMSVQYFLWSAVYASAPESAALGTFPFGELITYFAIGWIVRVACYNNIDRELADRISQGDIALDLLRPVSLLARYYGEALGETAFRIFFMGLPVALVLFPLFQVSGPVLPEGFLPAAVQIAAFLLSLVLAFHSFFLMNFLVGAATVFFEKIRGLLWSKFVMVQFLSGLMVPFDFFPDWAGAILGALPFRSMMYGPLSLYLGRARGAAALGELGLQALWVAILYLLSRWLWSRCRRKLMIQGG
jgi:ABC-2 type transport system permease protein